MDDVCEVNLSISMDLVLCLLFLLALDRERCVDAETIHVVLERNDFERVGSFDHCHVPFKLSIHVAFRISVQPNPGNRACDWYKHCWSRT